MDSITHIVLGAVSGEAVAGKKIGKHAILLGAAAQSLPDIDVIESLWLSPADNLLAHRGITHSLLFLVLCSIMLAAISKRLQKKHQVKFIEWVWFYGLQISLHLTLDLCNAYGTGLLEPFSDKRFSLDILFVADPFFTLPLIAAAIALVIMSSDNVHRKKWIYVSLLISTVYLIYAVTNKIRINSVVTKTITAQHLQAVDIITTPTPLNTWLWFVAVERDDGFSIGYCSVWDTHDIVFTYHPRNDSLLRSFTHVHEVNQLVKFSRGFYTLEQYDSTILLNNLRFGQIGGWQDPKAPFAFRYYLNRPEENLLVVQRGRFSGWSKGTVKTFIERIRGN